MDEQFTVHSGGGVAIAGLFGAKVLAAQLGAGVALFGASPDDTLSDGYVELAGGL